MLSINSIKQGIVIDHIKAGSGIKLFELLNLKAADYPVALIMNVPSQQLGRKDLIKIENNVDMDLNLLSLVDRNLTINIIQAEKIVEKRSLVLPQKINSVIKCTNPRCITGSERNLGQSLSLVDSEKVAYKCDYCEHIYKLGQ